MGPSGNGEHLGLGFLIFFGGPGGQVFTGTGGIREGEGGREGGAQSRGRAASRWAPATAATPREGSAGPGHSPALPRVTNSLAVHTPR